MGSTGTNRERWLFFKEDGVESYITLPNFPALLIPRTGDMNWSYTLVFTFCGKVYLEKPIKVLMKASRRVSVDI